jgi:hypothetical protein
MTDMQFNTIADIRAEIARYLGQFDRAGVLTTEDIDEIADDVARRWRAQHSYFRVSDELDELYKLERTTS